MVVGDVYRKISHRFPRLISNICGCYDMEQPLDHGI